MLRPGVGPGGQAPREALVVRPRAGGGPLGGGDGGLRRGADGHGPGGGGPGEAEKHQEEHARPAAPTTHRLLPRLRRGAVATEAFWCLAGLLL